MAADWGLLAKSAVGAVIAVSATALFPPSLAVVAGSAALSTLMGDLSERTIKRLHKPRPPEQSSYDRAVDAALAAIAAATGENNIDDAQAERLTQALAPLLSGVNLSSERLTAAGFDAGKLADAIIDSRPRLCDALSAAEITLARRLLTAGVTAALAQPELLTASEAAFRAAVLAGFHDLPRELRDFALDLQAKALLEPPQSRPFTGRAFQATSTLLDARFGDLPLVGRDDVLADVAPALIVVDYAENRAEDLRRLAAAAVRRHGPGAAKLRLALLARGAGEWWENRKSIADRDAAEFLSGPTVQAAAIDLEKLPAPDAGPIFAAAAAAFAKALNIGAAPAAPDLTAAIFRLPLFVRIAALAAVEKQPAAKTETGLLDWALDREDRLTAQYGGYPQDRDKRNVADAAALATLTGGAPDRDGALALLRRLRDYAPETEERYLDWLKRLHPGPGDLNPLTPDRLGEHLADRQLTKAGDRGGKLLAAALGDAATAEEKASTLTVLVRLAAAAPECGAKWLNAALSRFKDGLGDAALASVFGLPKQTLALREVAAALTQLALDTARRGAQPGDIERQNLIAGLANNLANRLSALGRPEEALEAILEAAEIYRRLAEQRPDAFKPELAGSLNNLSTFLSALGRREEALEAITEAVELYRQLAEQRPDAFKPYLAMSLNNMANRLSELGRREEALDAILEAAAIYRQMAEQRPDAFKPDLAGSLNNLSLRLSALGRREEALDASIEAVSIIRQLAEQRPDAFKPDLATSLNNLAGHLSALGRREEALQASVEAASIRRQLAEQRPDAFKPDLAMSLNNLSAFLSALGRREEALQAILEAVSIRRQLAEQRPDAFKPDLATSLNNLANRLSDLGRREEALKAILEAVSIRRQLAEQRPDAFKPDLAGSLNNLANRLSALGRREEALEAILEAAEIYRQLAEQRPDAFKPDLAMSLNNMANRLSELGRREEALEAILEAVSIRRQLAEQRPDAFTVDLATSLGAQGGVLQGAERTAEAAAAFAEGLRLILPYARRYGPALAQLTAALTQYWLKAEPAPDEALLEETLEVLRPFLPPTDGADG